MPKSITLTMIVLNEEQILPRLLASVRQHVDDLIIVDTGSTDRTREIALAHGARVLHYTAETNPEGFMMDDKSCGAPPPYSEKMVLANYGAARQVGLDAAQTDFVLWLDADDVFMGGDKLRGTVDEMEAKGLDLVWMKYNYGRDPMGRIACELWRERLVRRGKMKWVNPIHEVMIPIGDPSTMKGLKVPEPYVDHFRPAERSAVVAHRNYKVLLRHIKANPNDARTLFYFANEARVVNPQQAIQAYERYCTISAWGEERCMAHVYVGEMYETMRDVGRAYGHYSAATVVDPRMPEGWFALARLAYLAGNWGECVRFSEEGFKRGIPDAVIMVNPMARTVLPHLCYHVALNGVGRIEDAYKSTLAGLQVIPEEPRLRENAGRFRRFLDEAVAKGAAATTPLSAQAREGITLALSSASIAEAPAPVSPALLELAALRLWKECLAGGEPQRAAGLLKTLPIVIRESAAVQAALARTRALVEDRPVMDWKLPVPGPEPERRWVHRELAVIPQPAWDQPQALERRTPAELREDLRAWGFRVHSAYRDGEHLIAWGDSRPMPAGQRVVIWAGPAVEPWTPLSPVRGGIGGSETACIEMARELAKRGYQVTVYSETGADGEGLYDDVDYKHFSRFTGCECDVFISSRQAHVAEMPIKAKLMLLWIHDVHVGMADPNMHRWLLRFDRLLCLSSWHRDLVLQTYPWLHPDKVLVTRNGIDASRFSGDLEVAVLGTPLGPEDEILDKGDAAMDLQLVHKMPPRMNRAFYSSSPNRGLDTLLDLWPRVRDSVPDAELHVFYGFDSWEATARLSGNAAELGEIERYKKRLAETPGVVWRGRVSQSALAHEMLQAKVWAYPTWFSETYCITALEAQAAGCLPICSNIAALAETVRWGVRLPGQPTEEVFRQMFVKACVQALMDEESRSVITKAGRMWALTKTWAALADEWDAMFKQLTAEVAAQPVPRYRTVLAA